MDTQDHEKQIFFELADRLQNATDPKELNALTEELARLAFGEATPRGK